MAAVSEELSAMSGADRDALAVLALAYAPVSLGEWTQLLTRADVRASADTMARLCERGVRKGLLEERVGPRRRLYATTPSQALQHLADARERGRLESLDRAVRRHRAAGGARRYAGGDVGWEAAGSALRVALVRDDAEAAQAVVAQVPRGPREDRGTWLARTLGVDPPSARWFAHLGPEGPLYLETLLHGARELLWPVGEVALQQARASLSTRALAAWHDAMRGLPERAFELDEAPPRDRFEAALAAAFWAGRYPQAHHIGLEAIDALSKRSRRAHLSPTAATLHRLTRVVIARDRPSEWEALQRDLDSAPPTREHASARKAMEIMRRTAAGGAPDVGALRHAGGAFGALAEDGWLSTFVVGLAHGWLGVDDPDRGLVEALEAWRGRAREHGYAPVADAIAATLTALRGEEPAADSLAGAYRPRQPWEVALDALAAIATEDATPTEAQDEARLAWELTLREDEVEIRPRVLEGRRARRGRPIALTRVLDGELGPLGEADQRVLAHVEYEEPTYFSRRRGRNPVLGPTALLGLVDHPAVMEPDGRPLVVTRGEPGISVSSTAAGLSIDVRPEAMRHAPIAWEEPSPGHLVVYERTPAITEVARVLERGRVEIPERGRDRLGEVLSRLGERVPIDAAGEVPIEGEDRASDPRPVALLEWTGTRLAVRLRVAPLGLDGPKPRAGEGESQLASIVRGVAMRARRDLADEVARHEALLDACPTLASLSSERGERRAEGLDAALEVLLELSAAGDEVVVAWPRGPRISAPSVRDEGSLRVRVRSVKEWLHVDASIPIDEGRVLGFRELLDLPRHGRFVEIEPGRFVAMTRELARRVEALAGLGRAKGAALEVSPALLPLIDELTVGSEERAFDEASQTRLEELLSIGTRDYPIPRAFAGELRDYQRAGFVWMMRLADAGLGGCLADDMGLGKTVQTLALLVARGGEGPALVVAPASVASNWMDEARRFAPTLRFHAFGASGRDETVRELGPRDVLVCTYGLLVTEAERLQNVDFDAVIFDEAHYLKNDRTKRARAAHGLGARVRLGLTGTPMENHVGELWSLMRATVPGLLGTKKRFEQRFGSAGGDRERSQHLKALLRPFLLRRTKSQVLDELPERTEITLKVTPTADERAFYEALRRRALASLSLPDGSSRMHVLAEITRLRQAAIDPRLVDPESGPPGAKLDALVDQLLALREEGHRALVFSQFLGSLARVAGRLDEAGLSYLTLEGSTPAPERARRIAQFQEGETDVFVMSLKAGGVGVNLTAADYVIHLDPWWNPAVEDQATGRAHRIGQRRPVTVYRFVSEGTIEEKILALHRDKRALADDLLAGMETSRALDLDTLRGLLDA